MSLIQDALKRKREEAAVSPSKETPPPAPPVTEPKSVKPAGKLKLAPDKLLIVLIILIIVSLISIGIIKFHRASTIAPKTTPQQSVETAEAPSAIAKVIEKSTEVRWPKLKLTGFASGGGQRMVFINGKMLAEGRKIDGARIIQIRKTEVLIDYQGERRILRVDDE